ncbi:MAG: TetR/AcrR family transcriptional regulator [Galbitalea sp.]
MALTEKGRSTRRRIVEGAAAFLRENDLGELTLDDVRAATATSKGQLFHYFPGGKDELMLEIMGHEAARVLDDQQPYLGDLSSWQAWDDWRRVLIARYRAQGTHCPLNSLMGKVGTIPGSAAVVTALLTRWQGQLAEGIRLMQGARLIRAELSPERTAAALVAGIQGGVVVMWSTGNTAHLESVLDVLFTEMRRS